MLFNFNKFACNSPLRAVFTRHAKNARSVSLRTLTSSKLAIKPYFATYMPCKFMGCFTKYPTQTSANLPFSIKNLPFFNKFKKKKFHSFQRNLKIFQNFPNNSTKI